MTLSDNLVILESSLAELKAERNLGPLQNDIYEATDDLCHLARRAAAVDTRVNYPVRARGDLALFQKLQDSVSASTKEVRERYMPILDCAKKLLRQVAQIPLPPDGHLGVLRIIRNRLEFLFTDYGFTVADEQPMRMRLTNGAVVLELGCAALSSMSFSISRTERRDYWIQDVLYLNGDQLYRSVPLALQLNAESDVDEWFRFIASVLRQYGDSLLRNNPGAFDRLTEAQTKRDAEYAAMMNEKYGLK